ncbi:NB-ARC domain-containing protein [Streptomyces sp. NPDC005799]|uniref:NB-ARC domain-containing protein n=1 Tax=Streptomyces sp. NPDC005799 TaxID=3154678 RepID=UPI0033CF0DDA
MGPSERIDRAASLLRGVDDAGRTTPPIGVVSGRSGTGKTALAVHVGHRTAELFPDGRLWLDLRAADTAPLKPAVALGRLLRAMGAEPETLPSSVEELTGLYRTHIAHRRVLLILDNAAGEAPVRPLLPPGPGSAVLVTSRRRLVALEDATHLDLTVPERAEALELLRRVAGPERTDAEPERAAEIVSLCGRLPLAVRIAGARLAARPHRIPGQLAGRLRDVRRRLPSGGNTPFHTCGTGVRTHSEPNVNAGVVDYFTQPTTVNVVCRAHAQEVAADGYTNDAWAKLTAGSWLTNIYIKGPTWLPGVPTC